MRIIEVVDYQETWKECFESEKQLLKSHLSIPGMVIHHIGSTSVPGLKAKPVIDLLIEVDCLEDADHNQAIFEQMGYESMGEYGIPGRRFYKKGGEARTHHIHLFAKSNEYEIKRHLAVRDYLRNHPEECSRYAAVKNKAAAMCNHDIEKYCDYKNAYVKELEQKALNWMK